MMARQSLVYTVSMRRQYLSARWLVIFLVLIWCTGVSAAEDKTGTDPRAFTSKFMPYYLHTELENEVEINQLNLFGMYAFGPSVAITYDLPAWKKLDFDDAIPGGGDESGIGDLGLRVFYKPESLTNETSSHMFGAEITLPTASDPDYVLGGDNWVLSPMYVYVRNIKLISPGFVAMMNFYDSDIDKGENGQDVSRFRGRWFLMQPLTRPGPNWTDGWYLLPELQPVYDFEKDDDEFSLWFAPEFGKMMPWGAMYLKPGIGVVKDADTDRDWTVEIGLRYFFK
jgi:hypothetical protein